MKPKRIFTDEEGRITPGKIEPETKAEYSMGLLDYQRQDIILKHMHECFILARTHDTAYITHFLVVLKELYKSLRPAFSEPKKKKYDYRFDYLWALLKNLYKGSEYILEKAKNEGIEIDTKREGETIFQPCERLQMDILDERHRLGVGFTTSKYTSRKKKIRRGLNV